MRGCKRESVRVLRPARVRETDRNLPSFYSPARPPTRAVAIVPEIFGERTASQPPAAQSGAPSPAVFIQPHVPRCYGEGSVT